MENILAAYAAATYDHMLSAFFLGLVPVILITIVVSVLVCAATSPGRLCDWCDFKALCPAFGGTPPPLPEQAASLALDPVVSAAVTPGQE